MACNHLSKGHRESIEALTQLLEVDTVKCSFEIDKVYKERVATRDERINRYLTGIRFPGGCLAYPFSCSLSGDFGPNNEQQTT